MSRRGENIRKRSDGRWEGRYIKGYDEQGKSKYGSVYAKSYLEVKRKLIVANEQKSLNIFFEKTTKLTFREVLYLWLDANRIKLREQTYAKYQRLVEQHIIPDIGMLPVSKITTTMVNQFLYQKSNNGRLDGKGGLSSSYIKTISFIVISALEFAVKSGFCQPLIGEIIRPNKNKKDLEVLSIKEQVALENVVWGDCDKRKVGVLLSLYAGLRIGEVCGLKWDDIDFENNTIHICRTVERVANVNCKESDKKTKLVVGDAKTISSKRKIPIPKPLIKLLKECVDTPDKYVIQGTTYPYTDPRTYQYRFHNYLEQSNLRNINFHALRHTFATRCVESGMDIKTLSEILGHANVNITLNTYVHSSMEQKRIQLDNMTTFCGQ